MTSITPQNSMDILLRFAFYLSAMLLGGRDDTRLPPIWPVFGSRTRRHMWVEFVVGSRPSSKSFSLGDPVFPSPQNQHQFDLESVLN